MLDWASRWPSSQVDIGCSEDESGGEPARKLKEKPAKSTRKDSESSRAVKGPGKEAEKPQGKAKAKSTSSLVPKAKAKAKADAKKAPKKSPKKSTPKKAPKKLPSKDSRKEEKEAEKDDDDDAGDGKASPTMKRPAAKTLPEGESTSKRRKAGKSPAGSLTLSCAVRGNLDFAMVFFFPAAYSRVQCCTTVRNRFFFGDLKHSTCVIMCQCRFVWSAQ